MVQIEVKPRDQKVWEGHAFTCNTAYARYFAAGDSLRSDTPDNGVSILWESLKFSK